MKLEIYKEEDRVAVAAILIRNGYKVCQRKERQSPTSKRYVYYLEVDVPEEEVES